MFAAMGVNNDVADYFRRSFEDSGVLGRVVMFLNLSNDPIIERILTPRCALTAAEYLAFELNMHILVIHDRYDRLRRGAARILLLQRGNPRPEGISRLSLFRSRVALRAGRHDPGQAAAR